MNDFTRFLLILVTLVYVVSPVDVAPGPIDDIIVMLMTLAANKSLALKNA